MRFFAHPSYEQAQAKNPAAKNPIFVRSPRQWTAGSITIGRGNRSTRSQD
jgi:hypothetical protein